MRTGVVFEPIGGGHHRVDVPVRDVEVSSYREADQRVEEIAASRPILRSLYVDSAVSFVHCIEMPYGIMLTDYEFGSAETPTAYYRIVVKREPEASDA